MTILVNLIIPSDLIRKTAGVSFSDPRAVETDMFRCIERAFGMCIGRSTHTRAVRIICTPEQFGIFVCLLEEKKIGVEALTKLNYFLFKPVATPPMIATTWSRMV